MAADEVLLEHVLVTGRPALRFYTWDPPTLSLGYFQPYAGRLPGLPVVRRMTGGGAIVHHHELTYAVGLPSGAAPTALARHGNPFVCVMHDGIRAALGSLGVTAAGCGREQGRGAFLCFEHQTPGDLLLGGRKIGGSAQRRRRGAILQHGSILLAASPHAPHLKGIQEMTGVVIGPERLADALAPTVSRMTGWTMAPKDWSAELIARRKQLAAEHYRQTAWTQRR
ncbi:MAG TPA: biotin/lipoate A/B protein ligase family protein [Gemmataceae bacterium]|jgi:lipoate-protein ligase A|nr:biotin/lipoate A/B protein ligase family protein [Gemmataceae bacterium]